MVMAGQPRCGKHFRRIRVEDMVAEGQHLNHQVGQARAVALSLTRLLSKSQRTNLVSRLSVWKAGASERRVLLCGPEAEREQERFGQAGLFVSARSTSPALAWGNSE